MFNRKQCSTFSTLAFFQLPYVLYKHFPMQLNWSANEGILLEEDLPFQHIDHLAERRRSEVQVLQSIHRPDLMLSEYRALPEPGRVSIEKGTCIPGLLYRVNVGSEVCGIYVRIFIVIKRLHGCHQA